MPLCWGNCLTFLFYVFIVFALSSLVFCLYSNFHVQIPTIFVMICFIFFYVFLIASCLSSTAIIFMLLSRWFTNAVFLDAAQDTEIRTRVALACIVFRPIPPAEASGFRRYTGRILYRQRARKFAVSTFATRTFALKVKTRATVFGEILSCEGAH